MPAKNDTGGATTTVRNPSGSVDCEPSPPERIISKEMKLIGVASAAMTITTHASSVTLLERCNVAEGVAGFIARKLANEQAIV